MKGTPINYVEFPAKDLTATKQFFEKAFGWRFTDYGPEYTAFTESGLEGGFYQSELSSVTAKGSALVVLYTESLEDSVSIVEQHGGEIIKPIFSFPGGRRFHFQEPSGNELAVWSDQ
ncbi:VOC family protein [Kangiella marina]|uniref:VOC family protein n=1 Tax=Kangiella marina TaxID=1079178 RepID=A0ABP8IN13_9GAMM